MAPFVEFDLAVIIHSTTESVRLYGTPVSIGGKTPNMLTVLSGRQTVSCRGLAVPGARNTQSVLFFLPSYIPHFLYFPFLIHTCSVALAAGVFCAITPDKYPKNCRLSYLRRMVYMNGTVLLVIITERCRPYELIIMLFRVRSAQQSLNTIRRKIEPKIRGRSSPSAL